MEFQKICSLRLSIPISYLIPKQPFIFHCMTNYKIQKTKFGNEGIIQKSRVSSPYLLLHEGESTTEVRGNSNRVQVSDPIERSSPAH